MNELKIQIKSIEEMWDFAKDLVKYCKPNQVIALNGDLGAGKTTLIQKLLKEALKGEKVVLIENESIVQPLLL
jgi:tRNA A37 threonylcarbamoyladenosine biosynthesis protein TsaE